MLNRHLSRSIILQTLFELDFNSIAPFNLTPSNKNKNEKENEFLSYDEQVTEEVNNILKRNIKEFAPNTKDDFFIFKLLELIIKKRRVIDDIIEKTAPGWPIENTSLINRNILRIGLTELLFGDREEVPPKVAINEAIELAKTFGGETSSRFINGVLGSVYKEIGEPGKEQKTIKKQKMVNIDINKLPVEKFGGALVYSISNKNIFFALVHDIFGYWTLSKGHIEEKGQDREKGNEKDAVIKIIKDEIGLDITIKEKLGENEYIASHPQKGRILKKVLYFLAKSDNVDLRLEQSGGLDDARWFKLSELSELKTYNDIVPLITKAIKILTNKSKQ